MSWASENLRGSMKFDKKFESAYICEILIFKISRNCACGILYQKSCNGVKRGKRLD